MDAERMLPARLRAHRLIAPAHSVTDAAHHMLAVQSQDFLAGRWALGVRSSCAPTIRAVDRAFARGDLVRSWTMRGTLHIVPARDLRWVLSVTAERQLRQAAARHRELGIDDELLLRAGKTLRPALADGGCTRAEAFALWERAGIDPRDQRGVHLLAALSIRATICQGPVTGGGQRFVAVDGWVPDAPMPADPLSELFVRYIDGHGPATASDFAWWSGLTLGSAREAAERARGRVVESGDGLFAAASAPRRALPEDTVLALPAFDEYYISYADRSVTADADAAARVGPGKNGMVRPTIVAGGRITGIWAHAASARGERPELFDGADADAAASAVDRFRRFLGDA